jgi:hypothetical protein
MQHGVFYTANAQTLQFEPIATLPLYQLLLEGKAFCTANAETPAVTNV